MDDSSKPARSDDSEDFVFRFPLKPADGEPVDPDPLVEMVRVFLEDFLRIGVLTKGGERVSVDGFAFVCEPERVYEIFPRKT